MEQYRGVQGPAGATPENSPLRSPMRRDRGAAMGQVRGKEGEKEAGGKCGRRNLGSAGNNGVCEASRVAHDFPGVGDKEGGREASGVAENPGGGGHHGVGGRVESHQGANTPGVAEERRGEETPGGPTVTEVGPGEDGRGRGGGQKPTHRPSKQDAGSQRQQRWADERTADGGSARHNGDGGGR